MPTSDEPLLRGDLFAEACPSREVLRHVTSRWGVLVLVALRRGTHRFSDLRRVIGGVSEKMLAQTLQALEADAIVLRVAHPVVPPHVDYSLTPLGRNEFICWVEDAKQAATRQKRIERAVEELHEGKRRPCCWAGCIHRTDKAPSRWQKAVLIDGKAKAR